MNSSSLRLLQPKRTFPKPSPGNYRDADTGSRTRQSPHDIIFTQKSSAVTGQSVCRVGLISRLGRRQRVEGTSSRRDHQLLCHLHLCLCRASIPLHGAEIIYLYIPRKSSEVIETPFSQLHNSVGNPRLLTPHLQNETAAGKGAMDGPFIIVLATQYFIFPQD